MDTIWQKPLAPSKGAKYEIVASTIRGAIGNGQLKTGEKLPPVRDLAYRLGITPGTVARAYSVLTNEGLLDAAVGRGTFVAEPKPEPQQPSLAYFPEYERIEPGQPINFISPSLPDVGQASLVRHLLAEYAANPNTILTQYPSQSAHRPAREAVLQWLKGTPLGQVDQEEIVLSHGGQNAILLVMQAVLRGSNPVVLVEELSYPGFRRAAEMLRAEVVPVPMDNQGLIPEALEEVSRGRHVQLLCTSPEVHNPTSIVTPAERRKEIARVARRRDFQILEDDCYRLGYASAPSYRMLAPERGWYVSSISKTLTPSLRVGFGVAARGRARALRRAAEYGFFGLALPLSDLTASLLTHPDSRVLVQKAIDALLERVRIAVNHLGAYDLAWREDVPFIWLKLPDRWRASRFCQIAEAEGIRIRTAEEFACRDSRYPHAVRIAINGTIPMDTFENAMRRLRELLDDPQERFGV